MSVCDIPVISSVCDTVGEGAATLVTAPFEWLATAMGEAAGYLVEAVWSVIDTTTFVDVRSPGYLAVYNLLFGLAVLLTLLFFCFQVITGLVRRDPAALSRAALGVAKAILGGFLAVTVIALLLEITDQLAVGIVQAAGTSMQQMGERVVLLTAGLATVNPTAAGMGAIVVIVLSGLAILAAVAVWFSLLIRKALLLVAIVFAPVALAGSSWDATRAWVARWATFVIALIVSKLVLVIIFLVAVTQIASPIEGDLASVSDPITGVVLLMLAAGAPYLSYKMLAFAGLDAHHVTSSEQEAKAAFTSRAPLLSRLARRSPAAVLGQPSGHSHGTTGPAQSDPARPDEPQPTSGTKARPSIVTKPPAGSSTGTDGARETGADGTSPTSPAAATAGRRGRGRPSTGRGQQGTDTDTASGSDATPETEPSAATSTGTAKHPRPGRRAARPTAPTRSGAAGTSDQIDDQAGNPTTPTPTQPAKSAADPPQTPQTPTPPPSGPPAHRDPAAPVLPDPAPTGEPTRSGDDGGTR